LAGCISASSSLDGSCTHHRTCSLDDPVAFHSECSTRPRLLLEVRRRPRVEARTRPSTPSRRPEFRETSTLVWASRDTGTRVQLGSATLPSAPCLARRLALRQIVLRRRSRHAGCGFQLAGESAGPNGSGRWSWRGSHAGPADRLMPEARRLRASRNAEPLERWLPGREAANNFAGSLSGSSSCYRQARDHQTPTAPRRKYGGASAVSPRQRRCAGRCL
jgi:hypothetical protein